MHDTDTFARMPALDSTAEQPPFAEILSRYEREFEVVFKTENYLVRDNGAVFRRARPQARRRRLDEVWTFGTLNRHSGYFEINGHVVHRIVATAFHGPGPTAEHVVDHIDTNRLNNRPDNLRWVTRLENILLNPITRARIEIAYGSLEAFFENPGACSIPNWEWMRIVTKEQVEESRTRLLAWAEKGQAGRGGTLGDWLYEPTSEQRPGAGNAPDDFSQGAAKRESHQAPNFTSPGMVGEPLRIRGTVVTAAHEQEPTDTPSLTTGAFQRKWRTPTEFPQCPESASPESLKIYLERLAPGELFARNRYGESTVLEAAIGPDGTLSVVCGTPSGVKDWSHARVFVEGGFFCHESGGMFFTREGAMKAHCIAVGAPFDAYDDSIDDYC
ncbi:HNH endonuclease signature motif containing protein [Mesorhizobium sp. M2A.F.Ca.ET.067.02.1.1]|uniref:HNH endonuclease signature motif containing protein n=1 Tax=Mesorhizobium sp. M2A.F.Ca.ET.067.02.1.1 TaxID=2496749 RepID=UPI000FD3430F|nr:HNH endonuclease signature motif containing protein [Mesorhizobium sp. M2A.F.Ca.ET.067.02.1.1]RUW81289.1 HNH endonuclease [Mesorhizobium sp. M2A.F.Ca.ET.067.02.1.1]TIU59179.1 MAG: HNH endonuclease [Mesorhizobium sp.]